MKIGILSRKASLYSTRRLVEVAKARGHEAIVIDPLRCYITITSQGVTISYKDRVLEGFSAIIPRIGASITFYANAVLRQFEIKGVFALNSSIAISRSRDKLRALQILARRDIKLPTTSFAHSTKMTEQLIRTVGGAPLVVKLLEGTQGRGVVLAETDQAARRVIDAFRELKAYFLVQEFISEASGSDLRCFVIGDKVVAAMVRKARHGEFRANLHQGGKGELAKITPEERSIAIKAAKTLGLNVAGVDLLRSNRGPLVIEVNSSPGLEGIESATRKDIAEMIISFVEKHALREFAPPQG